MDACPHIRDQLWAAARPPKPGKNECQILMESWVRGGSAVVENFTENALGNMLRPCSKDSGFDPLSSWKLIKRDKRVVQAPKLGCKEQNILKTSLFQRPSYLKYLPNFIPGNMTQVFPYVLYRSLVTKQSSLGYNLWFNLSGARNTQFHSQQQQKENSICFQKIEYAEIA